MQVYTPSDIDGEACDALLTLDGAFHVFVVDAHGERIVERAQDETVSTVFFDSIPDIAMRIATIRTVTDVHHDPIGRHRSALIEFDRTALLVLPSSDRTFTIALMKEAATPALIAQAKTILEHRTRRTKAPLGYSV
jgi:hypothetical protein